LPRILHNFTWVTMETEIIDALLDRYQKAIEMYIKYKERVERHEKQLREMNQTIQLQRGEIEVLKAKLNK
jgi:hypothetical protein